MTAARTRLTPESKAQLRTMVRGLRESLVRELRTSVDQRYRLQLPAGKASPQLSADRRERRRRLEEALAQRAQEDDGTSKAGERALLEAVKETGATLLNRLVLIRHLEAMGLSKPAVVTGGWKSPGYVEFRGFAGALCEDETQGYGALLQLIFDELAQALPGLFGDVGFTKLIPVPPETLRELVEALDSVPTEAWRDDMTLGWVYQYWNDPDREALDVKLNEGGKVAHHEIASKTQMFTERYMVDWLLQNSLGPTWLAMCQKNGWTAEVEARGVLSGLDARRTEWRRKREDGEVKPDALMLIDGALEEAWKYYVPQPLTAETVKYAPASLRDLRLLDPACGSGHFLVVAFDLLVELYREEARHRCESWSDRQIAEWILEENLHGVDIDPRAVQIAAASIFLKAKVLARNAGPRQVNLVAPVLRLSSLSKNDPALLRVQKEILAETGMPPELTRQIIEVLKGVDYLGTLLKVGDAVDKATEAHMSALTRESQELDLGAPAPSKSAQVMKSDAKKTVLEKLNTFLSTHAGEEDLGLRLRGQQLAAGVRFASIVKEGQFHIVAGNPPYQDISLIADPVYILKQYPRSKANLYSAFVERGLELCRPGGALALITMRGWMFVKDFKVLREFLFAQYDLRILGDVDRGAFEEVPDEVVATAMSVFRKAPPAAEPSVALQPTPLNDKSRDSNRTARKRAAVLAQAGRFEFSTHWLKSVEGQPLTYWWDRTFFEHYASSEKLGEVAPVRYGAITGDNTRFIRRPWEIETDAVCSIPLRDNGRIGGAEKWVRYLKGAKGAAWIDPCDYIVRWLFHGLEVKVYNSHIYKSYSRKMNERTFFQRGVAFTMIGRSFAARAHRFRCIVDGMASSVFTDRTAEAVCLLNAAESKHILESLNPTIHFEVGDVNRLPMFVVEDAAEIFSRVERAFSLREAAREPSLEFRLPGVSPWRGVQDWAQQAVNRSPGEPLPPYNEVEEKQATEASLSFGVGIAMGRFGANGEGILPRPAKQALPDGILYVSPVGQSDSVDTPACAALRAAWVGRAQSTSLQLLRDWLRNGFFSYHRSLYESRPIYFPLASEKACFIAYISIHRWTDSTLSALLAHHLIPERKALEGALVDLQAERGSTDKKIRANAEKRYIQHKKWLEELEEFIAQVRQCAEKGPPVPDDKTPPREVDLPYRMNLDDGVMVNSAALWPLLEPLWKDPKKWWKELATVQGRKDYDWSHLAARYFPDRVDEKCRKEPSLAVAHGCFWKYHPERAYQWELRLQEEIGPDFHIDESDSNDLRAAFLKKNAKRARELESAEQARRDRKAKQRDHDELDLVDAEEGAEDEEEEDLSA